MADLTVKYFNSGMTGAPQISNNWGDLVTMLDACLVNGFALKAIDTLTCVDGVATATISAGHAYRSEQVVEIAGADQPAYNGQFRVIATTATTFTFAVTGTPVSPATSATSLSAKVAPLGWEKAFAGTNKAAYRSKNPASPQNLLLIDNSLKTPNYTTSWAKWANGGIVEDLADIDTIVGICYVKDFLPYVNQPVPDFIHLKDMVRPAYFIPETKKCSQLFKELKERRLQIAIIVDEYGGTAGLVTLEDLMESIFGNIQDEYDNEQEEIFRVSENEFTVDGTTSIDEISDLTDTELPEGDYDTIAGLVTDLLGRIPKENEHPSVQVCGLTITVLEIEDQRLSRLLIVKNDPRRTPEEETHED